MPGIKLGLAMSKANSLYTVLLLQPLKPELCPLSDARVFASASQVYAELKERASTPHNFSSPSQVPPFPEGNKSTGHPRGKQIISRGLFRWSVKGIFRDDSEGDISVVI